ncbi:MAG: CidA/LrgA family protein [Comamonas sp.]
MLQALLVLLVFQWLGQVLVTALGIPFPGALAGTLLLLIALLTKRSLPSWLEQSGQFLLQNMMLLFIPTIAGVMLHFDRLSREWLPFVLSCVVGAALTLVATALTFKWMMGRERARHGCAAEDEA